MLVTFDGVDKVVNNDDIVLLFEKLDDGVGTHVSVTKQHNMKGQTQESEYTEQ
jgi:hypothetical protein